MEVHFFIPRHIGAFINRTIPDFLGLFETLVGKRLLCAKCRSSNIIET